MTINTTAKDIYDRHKIDAEIAQLIANTAKLNKEPQWHPVFVAASIIGATAAVLGAVVTLVKVFL